METLKLEENHLVPYLLSGLKLGRNNGIGEYYELTFDNIHDVIRDTNMDFADDRNKPIFYPLSSLTKPIQHNGEEFVPKDKFKMPPDMDVIAWIVKRNEVPAIARYAFVQQLIKWKFNVFSLPDHLWIDVNTLDINPYK